MASTQLKPLTSKDVARVFDVSHMTLLNWRKPREGARKTALPCVVKDHHVSFNAVRIRAWAKKNGVEMTVDPLAIAGGTAIHTRKPGPKPSGARTASVKRVSKSVARK